MITEPSSVIDNSNNSAWNFSLRRPIQLNTNIQVEGAGLGAAAAMGLGPAALAWNYANQNGRAQSALIGGGAWAFHTAKDMVGSMLFGRRYKPDPPRRKVLNDSRLVEAVRKIDDNRTACVARCRSIADDFLQTAFPDVIKLREKSVGTVNKKGAADWLIDADRENRKRAKLVCENKPTAAEQKRCFEKELPNFAKNPVATHGPGFDAWKYFQFNRCSNHWALASARENIRSFDHSQEVCASLVGDIRKECYLAFATRNAYKPNPYLGPGSSLLRNVWQKTLPGKCSIVTAPDFSRDVGEGKPCTTIYRHYFDKEVERKKRALTAEEEKKFADAKKKMHQANVRAVGQGE